MTCITGGVSRHNRVHCLTKKKKKKPLSAGLLTLHTIEILVVIT